jgi:seryl-tRNA synthetase
MEQRHQVFYVTEVKHMTLDNERRELEVERRSLERERREFTRRVENEVKRLEQQQQLLDTKLKILEEEFAKLADEKEKVKKQKAFYRKVSDFTSRTTSTTAGNEERNSRSEVVRGDKFFSGVNSKQSIKKRYKDLIKIYHPDNMAGDSDTVREINSEYNKLCARYKI